MKNVFLVVSLVLSAVAVAAEGEPRISKGKKFVHPGIFYTEGDFGRMRAMVAAGREPWKKSFEALRFSPYANSGAWARPRGGVIEKKENQVRIQQCFEIFPDYHLHQKVNNHKALHII